MDLTEATREGKVDGVRDGSNEGQERGHNEGLLSGSRDGLIAGRDRCTQEMTRINYERGFADGSTQGDQEGRAAGHEAGTDEGADRGNREGTADGRARADAQARSDSQASGRQRGIEQANQSDATRRGQSDGTAAGDAEALQRANTYDYNRGREDQRAVILAEAVVNNDSFSQRSGSNRSRMNLIDRLKNIAKSALGIDLSSKSVMPGDVDFSQAQVLSAERSEKSVAAALDLNGLNIPQPDFRYLDDSREWPTAEEATAYRTTYRQGYLEGYRLSYAQMFETAYRTSYPGAEQAGCVEAQRGDYRAVYNQGFQEGRQRAYTAAYDAAARAAADAAYRASFPQASRAAYAESYNDYYNSHFEAHRLAAYNERVNQLYRGAHEQARAARYAQVYPGYAQTAHNRGKHDEIEDFRSRPIRLLSAELTETIPNGVFEPGETIRVKMKLRNFANAVVRGSDVKLQLRSSDNGVVIAEADAPLARDLRAKSVTEISEAMDFRVVESSANRNVSVKLSVSFQSRASGDQSLGLRAQFMTSIEVLGNVSLREGLPTQIRATVKNQADVALDPSTKLKLIWATDQVQVLNPEIALGAIAPGQSRTIEFTVIGRTAQNSVNVPIALQVIQNGTRRIGLRDLSGSVPVLNDYRVVLTQSASSIRNRGVSRAHYKITNVSSRFLLKGLQLKIRIRDSQGSEISSARVIGPNPQYLQPVQQGAPVEFVIPITSQGLPNGGTLELEVQEDGSTVVIHQANI